MLILPLICVAQIEEEPTENPDEYRDCVVYTLEEAEAATAPTGNQVIFTFSGLMTRAEGDNVDCGIISYIDAPSSEAGNGDDSNGGGSIIGGGSGGSSGNGGGSSSGGNSGGGTPSVPSEPEPTPEPTPEPEPEPTPEPEPEPTPTPTPTPTPEPDDEECPEIIDYGDWYHVRVPDSPCGVYYCYDKDGGYCGMDVLDEKDYKGK